MEIKGENYRAVYNPATTTVTCQGSFRLRGQEEYGPIEKMLDDIVNNNPAAITLDLTELEFLNSSGINMLSKFVIKVRRNNSQLIIQGSQRYPWQDKSLRNLKRLMPNLTLEFAEA
jgi:hypothetical protein